MEKNEYLSAISKQRVIQRDINNIYIWSKMAVLSLYRVEHLDGEISKMISFTVPSKVSSKKVLRSTESIKETVSKARTTELYKSLLVYIVSLVEPVLMEIVRLTLLYDKRRLKTKPNGVDGKLECNTILDCNDYPEILNVIITKYIDALSYSKPSDQIEYIQKLLSIEIKDDLWAKWIEVKASRDLIVHNKGIINKVYLDKVSDKARGELGKEIIVDEKYFDDLIVLSKSLVGQIVSQIIKNEKGS